MGDLWLAIRTLRKNSGFTVVAVLTLALGIGANTAIFSVVKAVLLSPLPFRDPGTLVQVAETSDDTRDPVTADFLTTQDLRERSRTVAALSLYRDASGALVEGGEPELLRGKRVGYDFFDTLGTKILLGRSFVADEDHSKTRYALILSHGLWMRRFGGDASVIGRKLRLSESTFTVVGVLPADFHPMFLGSDATAPDIYMPLGYDPKDQFACRGCQHLRVVGRLRQGVKVEQARTELNAVMRGILEEHPKDYARGSAIVVTPLAEEVVGRVRDPLLILSGAVGFVLLIACANVANLVLARSTRRSREVALRAALGASRGRLVQQLSAEGLVLALAGGVGGVLLAGLGISALLALAPGQLPRVEGIRLDGTVLVFALFTSVFTALLFGLLPALRTSRVDLAEAMKDLGKSTGGPGRSAVRNALVAVELAMAFVLVAGAGLMAKSFLHLMNVDPGYDPRHVLTLSTYVYSSRYAKPEAELNYYKEVLGRLRASAGIESAAFTSTLPLSGWDRRGFQIRDRRLPNDSDAPAADTYSVSPDYFRVMKIPLKRGRLFNDQDAIGVPKVAMISETCARQQFPNEDAIGKQIQLGGREDGKPWMTIVGIVGDIRQYGLDRKPNMEAYIAQAQDLSFGYDLVARTAGDPSLAAEAVRGAFLAVDRTQPVYQIRPLEAYLSGTLARRSFTLSLLAIFGVLALVLASIGIYGVISYAVTMRTREVGIRMALGARRSDVLRMVLQQGLKLIAVGLGAGWMASLALTRVLESLLFDVKPADLVNSFEVAVLLAVVALAASWIPARRASTVDPMVALRYE